MSALRHGQAASQGSLDSAREHKKSTILSWQYQEVHESFCFGMQEHGENLFALAFSSDTRLSEVLEQVIELRKLLKQSEQAIDYTCQEFGVSLDQTTNIFKANGKVSSKSMRRAF